MVRLDATMEVKCVKIRGDLTKRAQNAVQARVFLSWAFFRYRTFFNAQSPPCPVRRYDIKNQKGCFDAWTEQETRQKFFCEKSINYNATTGRPHFPESSGLKKTCGLSPLGKRILLVCHRVHRLLPDGLPDHARHAIPLPHGRQLNASFGRRGVGNRFQEAKTPPLGVRVILPPGAKRLRSQRFQSPAASHAPVLAKGQSAQPLRGRCARLLPAGHDQAAAWRD